MIYWVGLQERPGTVKLYQALPTPGHRAFEGPAPIQSAKDHNAFFFKEAKIKK